MRHIPDAALDHLRQVADEPDLSGTPYRLRERLARGGMGTVYRAYDRELDREVALKVLSIPDPDGRATTRMLREARILARLEHPGIVPIHDVGTLPDGRPFYVMKLVRGQRLDAFATGDTPVVEKLRIFQRLCEAVAFAHDRGVVHRDLKPENIMIGAFGEVLALDWGVAKLLPGSGEESPSEAALPPGDAPSGMTDSDGLATRHGTILGTPGYMAPEQAQGEVEHIGPRADVYALGALLWHLLTGGPPEDPTDLPGDGLPRPLVAICSKALAKDPEGRYPGAGAMAEEVSRYLAQLPVTAHRESLPERLLRLAIKYRVPILILLAYLLVRAALILWTGR